MGEHSERYAQVGAFFLRHGYRLCAYDLRGHGRSLGRRGYIRCYDDLLDDLQLVLEHHRREGLPLFLYGHSMGGQITLNYLLSRRPRVCGAIITSPWLELAFRPAPWKTLLAKLMVNLWPTFTQEGPGDTTLLSRDEAFLASMDNPDLTHRKISARMFDELTRGGQRVIELAGEFRDPLLLIHGADDALTSAAATENFFHRVGAADKSLKIYPSMRHEPHNDFGRETVLADMVEWMDARCENPGKQSPA
jgi:alpha-beta hydrolase superfamily lysophospholipase